jgi:hypothetical protein
MRRVYTAPDLAIATMLLHYLEHHLIRARVFNEHMSAVRFEVPFDAALPQIWVERDTDYERARALIKEFEQRPKSDGPDIACKHCNEPNPSQFESCWSCGQWLGVPSADSAA